MCAKMTPKMLFKAIMRSVSKKKDKVGNDFIRDCKGEFTSLCFFRPKSLLLKKSVLLKTALESKTQTNCIHP